MFGGNDYRDYLIHHGIRGQKWGKRNGPPYPLSSEKNAKVRMNARYDLATVHMGEWELTKVSKERLTEYGQEQLNQLAKIDKGESLEEIRKNINHGDKNDIGRVFNCQNCSVAFELVERGYDVQAKPRQDASNVGDLTEVFKNASMESLVGSFYKEIPKRPDVEYVDDIEKRIINETLSRKAKKALLDKDGSPKKNLIEDEVRPFLSEIEKANSKYEKAIEARKEKIRQHDEEMRKFRDQATTIIENKLRSQGNGARGIIITNWGYFRDLESPRSEAFHAFNYKIENGQVKYYDAQSYRNANGRDNHWIGDSDLRDIYAIRTDNLEVSEKVGDYVYSNPQKEKK